MVSKSILLLAAICLTFAQTQAQTQAQTTGLCQCKQLRDCLEVKKNAHMQVLNDCHSDCKNKLPNDEVEKCLNGKRQELERGLNSMADCIFDPTKNFCLASTAPAKRDAPGSGASGPGAADHHLLPSVLKDFKDCVQTCIHSKIDAKTGGTGATQGAGVAGGHRSAGNRSRKQHVFAAVKSCTDSLGCKIDNDAAASAFKDCRKQNGAFLPKPSDDPKREICECVKKALPADQTANMEC